MTEIPPGPAGALRSIPASRRGAVVPGLRSEKRRSEKGRSEKGRSEERAGERGSDEGRHRQ
jgi:hypothetical protein